MGRIILSLLLLYYSLQAQTQTGQLTISRIGQMPDSPLPLQIRDWNTVAHDYDSYVFNTSKTGQFLPLSRLGTQGQFNYSGNTPIFMDSYVGVDAHLNQAEAICIIPAIVGASLAGIDKSNQDGLNWVAMTKDFFNLKNGQYVYLNGYSTSSGNDWWYDVMPNIYFYQLKSLYPNGAPEFSTHFTSVADRWLFCVNKLGGSTTPWTVPNMNYRAFNLITGLPLNTSVPEPESAGSIGWLLYNAYLETSNRKYLEGANLAIGFLADFNTNPSYELQLPYGTITAARMNAIEGTNFPLQKMLDWCFDRGDLRGWGSVIGNWGGYDVSGLIGEANDGGDDYAFVMNGFQQAAALAPLPKYDKRYARAIAKWLLNITNASRLFYWNALPQVNQDSYNWAAANDPSACIPYESMKELWTGKTPFATGDAIRGGWASTNLSLYSGSSVGYLAAVVKTTNIPDILQIDLNKTDFYGENAFASYLYYNPGATIKLVNVNLPEGSFGVYDAITEAILSSSAAGSFQLQVPAGEVRLIRLYPAGLVPESHDGRLYAGNNILDYNYQYSFTAKLNIKALSVIQNSIITNSVFNAWCEPQKVNPSDNIKYEWYLNDILIPGQTQSQAVFTAPGLPSGLILKCRISCNSQVDEDTLQLQIVEHIPMPPVVTGIQIGSKYTVTGDFTSFTAIIDQTPGEILEYNWSTSTGNLIQNTGNPVTWQASGTAGVSEIAVLVTNQDMLSTTFSSTVLVKDTSIAAQTPMIYYPFDKDNLNASADQFHANVSGVTKTEDSRGIPSLAYRFTSGQNIIYTENNADLNFSEALGLSCWFKCEELGSEKFLISHGSWQQRYKLSITPEGRLRWTVKTNTGIVDLDGSALIDLNRFYHVTALYTGYSMELYINGILDTYRTFSGVILASTKPITIGRMDEVETQYAFRGSIDEVKIWNKEIPVSQIQQLKNQWSTPAGIIDKTYISSIYPNPADEIIYVEFTGSNTTDHINLYNIEGRDVPGYKLIMQNSGLTIEIPGPLSGLHLLLITLKDGRVLSGKITII